MTAPAQNPAIEQTTAAAVLADYVDNYITAPDPNGRFASVVERNIIFRVPAGTIYQIRLQRSGTHDYALLSRWSSAKEDWSIVAKRRPSEFNIAGYFPAPFDEDAFYDLELDLAELALDFEDCLQAG